MSKPPEAHLPHRAQAQRLALIEQLLWWRGSLRRADLTSLCGISLVQATIDLRVFQQRRPGMMHHDRKTGRYVASPKFSLERGGGQLEEATALLERLPREVEAGPWCSRLKLPARRAESAVIRAIVRAMLGEHSLRIRYASLNSNTFRWRWISPHALGMDGCRWHVRAFCHDERDFRDFVIGRIAATGDTGPALAKRVDDQEWVNDSTATLKLDPTLGPQQRRALELDFRMIAGSLKLHASKAMMLYALAALGLNEDGAPIPARFRAC